MTWGEIVSNDAPRALYAIITRAAFFSSPSSSSALATIALLSSMARAIMISCLLDLILMKVMSSSGCNALIVDWAFV